MALEISILLFAALKDAVGADRVTIALPTLDATQKITISQLLHETAQQHPQLAAWLPHVKVAVNFEYSNEAQSETQHIGADDEIALLPPVSGGA